MGRKKREKELRKIKKNGEKGGKELRRKKREKGME